jgi:hypothetical protein
MNAGGLSYDPTAVANTYGLPEVFVRSTDTHVYHKYQNSDGSWSAWHQL